MNLSARVERLETKLRNRQTEPAGDPTPWDWFAETCPCGKPPGECVEHPRARRDQRPPEGDEWRTWAAMAGRGWGKNRALSEYVRHMAETGQARRIALVAATAADARDVMVEGESGILACCPPWNRPKYEPSKRRLTWPNGALATTYSAEEPERLRGPQHDLAAIDELGSWHRPAALDNLKLGLRLGERPRLMAGFTPRSTALVRSLLNGPATVRTGGTTYENRLHLATTFFDEITSRYEGTRLGRQEIHAELIEFTEGAWFGEAFSENRHVTTNARFVPGMSVWLAVDAGVSRYTAAVWFHVYDVDLYRKRVVVFADYLATDLTSEQNAQALVDRSRKICNGMLAGVRLDPASNARTGTGPVAYAEYCRIFGGRSVQHWPLHGVVDGLQQLELMLGPQEREPDLIIHPECKHLIHAFKNYARDSQGGEWLDYPKDPQHEAGEDVMDALRGGVRAVCGAGRRPEPQFRRVPAKMVF